MFIYNCCTGTMKNVEGIESIEVSLEKKLGTVKYKPDILSDTEIADRIADMGFQVKLIGSKGMR